MNEAASVAKILTVGFLTDGPNIPRWVDEVMTHVAEHPALEGVILCDENKALKKKKKAGYRGLARLLYACHEAIDSLLYGKKERKDDLIAVSQTQEFPVYSHEDALGLEVDVLIDFSEYEVSAALKAVPAHGTWTVNQYFEKEEDCRPGYWQTTQRQPETTTALWQEVDGGERELLYISSQITDYHSFHKNRDKYYKRAVLLVNRLLNGLVSEGTSYLDRVKKESAIHAPTFFRATSQRFGIRSVIRGFGVQLRTLLSSLYFNTLYLDHWFVLFRLKSQENENYTTDFQNYTPLVSPKDRFWADPFVISRDGFHYIFVEELMYATSRGRLAVIKLDAAGKYLESKPILDTPYHLSYPYVFQLDGVDYMIPETRENKTVDLYRCVDFPYEWKHEKTLMRDIQAVDVTPFYHQGKWWIFCNVDEGDGNSSINDELYLYYCDDLLRDTWIAHPKNPLISDVKRARPAGKVFEWEGKLIRPSQDCSKCYGSALNMNEIITLSETVYEEVLIDKHRPDWELQLERIHTYNFNEKMAVIDSFYFRKK